MEELYCPKCGIVEAKVEQDGEARCPNCSTIIRHKPLPKKPFDWTLFVVAALVVPAAALLGFYIGNRPPTRIYVDPPVRRDTAKTDTSMRAKAAMHLTDLAKALEMYRVDTSKYPTTEQGLDALRTAPQGVDHWKGPYIAGPIPKDPWGNDYMYTSGGATFELVSYAADGVKGGKDDLVEARG